MAVARARTATKDRLITAASALFAERGFHATTIRDIAARAGANVAAGNYHYGSKKALYLEVLRAAFAEIRNVLRQRGAAPSPDRLACLGRAELEKLIRSRAKAMLDLLLGPPPGVHGTLMQREMCDPSEALPVIVEEFIVPRLAEMRAIIAHLAPGLDPAAVDRCVFSIIGQVLFYRFMMPAMLVILGLREYPRGLTRQLADHITEFSLGGMDRLGRRPRRHRAA
jgi:AcrR family transcriptional regulator